MAEALADELLDKASAMPPMPGLAAARFTFIAYRKVRELLLSQGSGGALEQYLLAGLLYQEMAQSNSGSRVETKPVLANDRMTRAAGDIEIRQAQALVGAVEVTAGAWDTKLDQLDTAAAAGLAEATIAAPGVTRNVSADDLMQWLHPVAERLGLDVAVLDLHAYMDVVASRITPYARAAAFTFVYRCLARWHRREPQLAQRLINTLTMLDLVADGESTASEQEPADVEAVLARLRQLLATGEIALDPATPAALRELAGELEGHLREDPGTTYRPSR